MFVLGEGGNIEFKGFRFMFSRPLTESLLRFEFRSNIVSLLLVIAVFVLPLLDFLTVCLHFSDVNAAHEFVHLSTPRLANFHLQE